jgi:hypothetical protein
MDKTFFDENQNPFSKIRTSSKLFIDQKLDNLTFSADPK